MHTEDDTLADIFIEADDLLTVLIRYGELLILLKN